MNRKAIVFGDAFMALILGTVVIVMMFSGVFISYNKLLCYTGVAWFTAPPTAHMGTAANLKASIGVTELEVTNYDSCISNCEDAFTDDASVCSKFCDKYLDQFADYTSFDVYVRNGGTLGTNINISVTQDKSMIWNRTVYFESGQEATISTSVLKISSTNMLMPCLLKFEAVPLDNLGMAPASVLVKPKDFKCLHTGSAS